MLKDMDPASKKIFMKTDTYKSLDLTRKEMMLKAHSKTQLKT